MAPSVQLDQTEYRNANNIINYYKTELISLRRGKKIVTTIPSGTRKRLVEYGIIRRFGSKFELTSDGDQLLEQISP
jgi:hypothetical protein